MKTEMILYDRNKSQRRYIVRNNKILLILAVLLALLIYVSPLGSLFLQSAQAVEDTQDNIANGSINAQHVVKATEEKFRVEPTVRIRQLSDTINKSADGIIEIYLENSNVNDVPLTAEINITVPSGIDIYGQGFGDAQATGVLHAKMGVPPGIARTAYINIKAEKTGNFYAQLNGTYYPGENKDKYQILTFTYPFSVYESSPEPKRYTLTNPRQISGNEEGGWTDKIVYGILIVIIAGLIGLGYKIVEIKYQYKMEIKNRISMSKVIEKSRKISERETSETKTTENK
jgi:hypothetical protein